jgi:hypothetical protein
LNYSSLQKTPLFDEHLKRKIVNLTTLLVNVFCEYLVSQSYRVRHAAFSALRLIFEHGLNKRLFSAVLTKGQKAPANVEDSLILNFDALSITEEVKRIRADKISGKSPKEKLLIHVCYLLTDRFTLVQDSIFRLMKSFIQHLTGP